MTNYPLQSKDPLIHKWEATLRRGDIPERLVRLFMFAANEGRASDKDPTRTFSKLARRWLERLYRNGVSDALLRDLNSEISSARFTMKIIRKPDGSGLTRHPAEMTNRGEVGLPAHIAMLFISVLEKFDAKKVKKCQRQDCEKFFFGGPRAKWCSNACGTYVRINKKRKLDRQRQML